MPIKILFDSRAIDDGYSTGWGFSCLVDHRILFDTGEEAESLMNNIDKMKVDVTLLEAVVISHDHWDHTGGLEEILKRKSGLHVYICPRFSERLKQKIKLLNGHSIENVDFCEIKKDIHVTGEIIGAYKDKRIAEQALVINSDKRLTVITGCAHPGIIEILEKVKQRFPDKELYAVLGGFHLMNENQWRINTIVQRFVRLGIKRVGPTHCSGAEAEKLFQRAYGSNYFSLKTGQDVEI